MSFNNKNKFYSLPISKNIGCFSFIIGIIVISLILFLGFFVGLFVLGFITLFYIYKFFKNKMNKNNNLNDNNEKYTEAEFIEINDEDNK